MKKTSVKAFVLALGVFAVVGIVSKTNGGLLTANAATQTGNNTVGNQTSSTPSGSSVASGNLVVSVDWNTVTANVDTALQNGEDRDVAIKVGTQYTVPVSTLNVLADRKKVLMLQTGNGMALSVSSEDVVPNKELSIDLSMNAVIPEDISKGATDGAEYCRTFSLNGDNALPFKVNVHFAVGTEYAGKTAVLYRYNKAAGKMVAVGSFEVTENGAAMFALRRGGEYIVTVTDNVPKIYGSYVVVSGDTLSEIARKNKVSLSSIIEANPQLTNANKIYVGQVLNIQ